MTGVSDPLAWTGEKNKTPAKQISGRDKHGASLTESPSASVGLLNASVTAESLSVAFENFKAPGTGRLNQIKPRGSSRRDWWRRDPHPMFSPKYAAQRLLVDYHYDQNGDRCSKGFVVFIDPTSIQKVLTDPHSNICANALDPEAPRDMAISIRPSSASDLERTVFIRVTGYQSAAEAREPHHEYQLTLEQEIKAKHISSEDQNSFSMTHDMRGMVKSDELLPFHKTLLPEKVVLDQVPMKGKTPGKYYSTFVPQLCDHLAEICSIRPPNEKHCGWLVSVSGSRDGRHMMHELQKIPGFLVRWADEGDGLFDDAEPALEASPLNCTCSFEDHPFPTETDDAGSLSTSQTNNHVFSTWLRSCPTHPHLRRALLHTYRGRPLIEDTSTGETKFLDESAIFVGRLNKRMETYATLYKRFEKYGKICYMEFNPKAVPSHVNNATARVMYQDKESAAEAIARENGSTSFGSAIKVELRRVIHSDVHTSRVYLDANGRIIRPPTVAKLVPEPGVRRITGSQPAIEARMQQPPFLPGLNMPSETYFPVSFQQPEFSQFGVGINMPMAAFPPHFSVSPPALSTRAGLQHAAILAYKEENGTVKAIYDDNELKAYCLQNDLPYPPKPEKKTKKAGTTHQFPRR
ncbi:hypothetical protein I309_01204 [Cryptococcus deuterogattii LA55]|nr:hypothetical protein I309_01204 [Cryptococcus deuterogattii LA55]KIR95722.1 hypothetical protein I304_00477 [Cryptococcus deuterogattii CBS 10090]